MKGALNQARANQNIYLCPTITDDDLVNSPNYGTSRACRKLETELIVTDFANALAR